ncbi:hypothetical protein [Caulobacter segnis]
MMTERKLAQAICGMASFVAPPQRRPLARGMRAELDHVADSDALEFAIGCLWSAAGWWLTTADGLTRGARFMIAVTSAGMSVACLAVAGRLWDESAALALWSLAAIGLFYAGAALVSWRRGLGALAVYALAGLALNTVAFLAQQAPGLETTPDAAFVRALAIEEYGLLALMLGLSLGARSFARRLSARSSG